MARYKYWTVVPPLGWFYVQQETGARIEGENGDDLITKVIAHRRHKNLPDLEPSIVRIQVERQLCSRLSLHECRPEGSSDEWVPVNPDAALSVEGILGASKAAMAFLTSGGQFIPESEAKARQAICSKCPANLPLEGCKCSSIFKILNAAVPKERRGELGVCGICGCSLAAKTNVPMNVVKAGDEARNLRYPPECWVRG